MKLARCPACQTIFRLHPEQLQAHGGRVRCGQCYTPFNALLHQIGETPPLPASQAGSGDADPLLPSAPEPAFAQPLRETGHRPASSDALFVLEERDATEPSAHTPELDFDVPDPPSDPDPEPTASPPWGAAPEPEPEQELEPEREPEPALEPEPPAPNRAAAVGPLDFGISDDVAPDVRARPVPPHDFVLDAPDALPTAPPRGADLLAFDTFETESEAQHPDPQYRARASAPVKYAHSYWPMIGDDDTPEPSHAAARPDATDPIHASDLPEAHPVAAPVRPAFDVETLVRRQDERREPSASRSEDVAPTDLPPSVHRDRVGARSEPSVRAADAFTQPPPPPPDDADLAESGVEPEVDDTADYRYGERRPEVSAGARWLHGLAVGVLLGLLGVQGMYLFRGDITRSWPELRPLFLQTCAHIGCEVPLARTPNLIGIETSDLQIDAAATPRFVLNAVVRNQAPYPQQYPHLEITLTDSRDRPVVRRVLAPPEWLPQSTALEDGFAGNGSAAVRLQFETRDVGVPVGYRMYAFYP